MPQFYKRKTERANRTTTELLAKAADKVDKGESIRKAAESFNIDKMTLFRFLRKRKQHPQHQVDVTGYKVVANAHYIIPSNMEKDLANHVRALADMFFGLSLEKCKALAYEFAVRNDIHVPDAWHANKKAGKSWWLGFKRRNNLSIRSPEATSLGRATAFNPHTVGEFYDNLSRLIDEYNFRPEDIYNLDETGCTTVQKPRNVITGKGRKQVGSITSAERGELVTVIYAISASGNTVPPMFIFPRVNFRDHFLRGGPPGCIGDANRSGWINEELFQKFLDHLIQHTRCSKDKMILLIMDNHESHVSLGAIEKGIHNGIVMLTIPPHTSHRLQPLDKSVFGPFKRHYSISMDGWMRSNQGKTVSIYDIPGLVSEAQMSAITPRNITSGFRAAGIYPFNRNLFSDADFAPATLTDRILQENDTNEEETHTDYVPPSHICPIPKTPERKKKSRRRRKTRILTSSEVVQEIREKESAKTKKKSKASAIIENLENIPVQDSPAEDSRSYVQSTSRRAEEGPAEDPRSYIQSTSRSAEKGPADDPRSHAQKPMKRKRSQRNYDDPANFCGGCDGNYYDDVNLDAEEWIQCQSCKIWYHEICAGVYGLDTLSFVCRGCF